MNILIVDDEQYVHDDLTYEIGSLCSVYSAKTAQEAFDIIEKYSFDYAIVDLNLDYRSSYGGIDIFNKLKEVNPSTKVIILSGFEFQNIEKDLIKMISNKEEYTDDFKELYICKSGEHDDYIKEVLDKLNINIFHHSVFGNYHALLIAAQEYWKNSGYKTLDYPIEDVIKIKDVLAEIYNFSRENIYTLINPSRENIIRKLCRLSDELNENDNLLIFYAGHGKKDAKNQKGYWIPCDAGNSAPQNWMSNADVVNWIARIKAKHKLMISDSCFSGTFAYTNRGQQDTVDYKKIYKCDSFKFISSANDNQTALDKSIFLDCFLNYLKNTEKSIFSAYDIFSDIAQKVEHRTKDLGKEQSIQYRKLSTDSHDNEELNDDGHFLFIKKINEGA